MIVVLPDMLRVAIALVLHFVGRCVYPAVVDRVVDRDAVGGKSDHAHGHTGCPESDFRVEGQAKENILGFDRVGIVIIRPRRI